MKPYFQEAGIQIYHGDCQGLSQNKIARKYGVTDWNVMYWMRRYGIPARGPLARPRTEIAEEQKLDVGYSALHYRIRKIKGSPKFCEVCGTTDPARTYEWANLTGNYNDPDDYRRVCRGCHQRRDYALRVTGTSQW